MVCIFLLQIVNYSDSRTVEEIIEHSTKLITLIDLAGHHKYIRTTIFGLTGRMPDFAMLVVSANTGMGKIQKSANTGMGKIQIVQILEWIRFKQCKY